MLHINFLPLESSTPRPLITEQLPLPFVGGHQTVHIPFRFLLEPSTSALRARSSRLRPDIRKATLRASQRANGEPQNLTHGDIRHRKILQAASQTLANEGGVSHV